MNTNSTISGFDESYLHLIAEAPCDFAWLLHKIDAAVPALCAIVAARQMLDKLKDRVLPGEREQFDKAMISIQQAISPWKGKGRAIPGICARCIHKNDSEGRAFLHAMTKASTLQKCGIKSVEEMRRICPYFDPLPQKM